MVAKIVKMGLLGSYQNGLQVEGITNSVEMVQIVRTPPLLANLPWSNSAT
jgi:hypothetical protein